MTKSRTGIGRFAVLAATLLAFAAHAQSDSKVIDETDRERWQAIGRVNVGGFKSRSICTGTLIAPDRVLTAAHCVVNQITGQPFEPERIFFVAGWHKGAHRGTSAASTVWLHPDFPANQPQHPSLQVTASDLAVIELASPIRDIVPARLSAKPAKNGPFAVLGYRRDRAQVLSVYDDCDGRGAANALIALSCDVVEGTSGAPVWQQDAQGGWSVAGVVSSRGHTGGMAAAADAGALAAFDLPTE